MHILIAGGSGFVGQILQEKLLANGMNVTILTRTPSKINQTEQLRAVEWLTPNSKPEAKLSHVDAIINLAGESINGLRWTNAKKQRIMDSRMKATREIIRLLTALETKPEVLVNASAVGYYGMSNTEIFTEKSMTDAHDFLATVVRMWEKEAAVAQSLGVRTVFARLGIVLGRGGALPLMALPYRFGAGGTVGSGEQWVSWIHVEDVAGLIQFAIKQKNLSGPLNVTAPEPVKMREFGKTIGRVLHRPHWLPVPSFAMKALLGEMSEMLLQGQKALPEKALEHRYVYKYPNLEKALNKSLK
ncbi:TIGR01777 family oxidoreductase [Bacillus sp. FJAT-50079]|uniref:TIGR01777 family oxidoreductase n=1 Tax=Bacillus sp. FJAT-50079 TaxID=2833577 RepID=UPI001BC8D50F|nr:TIGR01777 family oxidoreductase [Bacillus sp. FJAT-50079]MBS4206514.1 TIGR01777 family oxidoreductase [Bacillus sp. FJAT-50079]